MKWIDVNERLPDKGQEVVIQWEDGSNGSIWKDVAIYFAGRWWIGFNGLELNVIRWLPLPDTPD